MPMEDSQDMPQAETGEESKVVQETDGQPPPLTVVSSESAPTGQQAKDQADSIASDPNAIEESGDKSIA